MKTKKQLDNIISLLDGEHNLTEEQRAFLLYIKDETAKAKTYKDLREIGTELLRFLSLLYGAS
ncbi:MAG: hypothetical protein Crog4KO_18840 [Crocinitomicaceae bacterium]